MQIKFCTLALAISLIMPHAYAQAGSQPNSAQTKQETEEIENTILQLLLLLEEEATLLQEMEDAPSAQERLAALLQLTQRLDIKTQKANKISKSGADSESIMSAMYEAFADRFIKAATASDEALQKMSEASAYKIPELEQWLEKRLSISEDAGDDNLDASEEMPLYQ